MNSIIDWLTYRSYEANRLRSPHVPYYKWRKIYQDALTFEEIFDKHYFNQKEEVLHVDFSKQ